MTTDAAPEFVTIARAAEILMVNCRSVVRLVDEGKLAAVRVPHCRPRISRQSVERLLAESTTGPADYFAATDARLATA